MNTEIQLWARNIAGRQILRRLRLAFGAYSKARCNSTVVLGIQLISSRLDNGCCLVLCMWWTPLTVSEHAHIHGNLQQ